MSEMPERLRRFAEHEQFPNFEAVAKMCNEAADVLDDMQAQIDSLQQKVHLCAGYDKLEVALKSIQKQSGDWYQGASSDGPAFVMKTIWGKCNEVFGSVGDTTP